MNKLRESFVGLTVEEIESQPDCWHRAGRVAAAAAGALPAAGERVAVVGCGTSWFIAQSYAARREAAGHGLTDAYSASQFNFARCYDRVVAISRSGTTTEVLDVLDQLEGKVLTTAITNAAGSPVTRAASRTVLIDFADERSVVQTRSATTTLVALRAALGEEVSSLAKQAERALALSIDDWVGADQYSFLGEGWAVGLAHEAALKMREAAQVWTESYPAMEYRHGPISIAQPGRITWMFGMPPDGLVEEVAATGARFVQQPDLDPLAQLVLAQRVAVATAARKGLDPDRPRHLTRSIVLERR